MIDIDETIRRIYNNPYEKEPVPQHACRLCGRGIYAGDERKEAIGGFICQVCRDKINR